MKLTKIAAVLAALALMLSLGINVCAQSDGHVVDTDDLFTDTEEADLNERIEDICQKYDFDIVILTVPENDSGLSDETFTADYFLDNGYGAGDARDGLILSVMNGRDYDTRTFCSLGHGYGEEAVGQYFFNCLFDESDVVEKLSDDRFYDGASEYLALADKFLEAYSQGEPYGYNNGYSAPLSLGMALLISLIILAAAFIIALIYVQVQKSKMRAAKKAVFARDYVVPGSFALRRQSDFFLYSTVSKVRIKSDSSSGGGRGGSFSSSGGSSFSGGSSRF